MMMCDLLKISVSGMFEFSPSAENLYKFISMFSTSTYELPFDHFVHFQTTGRYQLDDFD